MPKKYTTLDDAYQAHANWNDDYCQSFGYSAAQANDDAAEKANEAVDELTREAEKMGMYNPSIDDGKIGPPKTKWLSPGDFDISGLELEPQDVAWNKDVPLPTPEERCDIYTYVELDRCEDALEKLASHYLKYNELEILTEFLEYLTTTYEGHYSQNNFQTTEFIIDSGQGVGFSLGNIIKYAQRYGKKDGRNKKDLMKIMHYALFALRTHELEVNE